MRKFGKKKKQDLIANSKKWQDFQKYALQEEMTDFRYLTKDRLVQETRFGDKLSVIVNFANSTKMIKHQKLAPLTAKINNNGKSVVVSVSQKIGD
jgi:hypothetical protein